MANAPFPIQPHLCGITIAYRNTKLIGEKALPRVPVSKQDFKYNSFPLAESFTLPDTKVGRKSRPNQVDFSATEVPASTVDYGLDDPIPQSDIDNASAKNDPVGRAVEGLTDLIALDREKRVADIVHGAANYPSGNKVTLSGNDQFSDFVNSNPLGVILAGLDAMMQRANQAYVGRAAWSKICQHPKVVSAVLANAGTSGIVTPEALAKVLGLDEILVGEGWLNTAKKGQTATMTRVWGKHVALLYVNPLADTQRGVTFGFTAEFGTRVAGTMPDPNIGLRGGQVVRVGESLKELVCAGACGYLIENAVA